MKWLLLLLFGACAYAVVLRTKMHSTGSQIQKMIKAGTYRNFLMEKRIHGRRKASQIPLSGYYDEMYLVNITLGTPPQKFSLGLNINEGFMVVPSVECKAQACKGYPESGYSKHQFDKTRSSTFVESNQTFNFGVLGGYIGADVLQIADLKVETQQFGLATSADDIFGYIPVDGIIGLNIQTSVEGFVPPMRSLIGQLDKPIFTIWLSQNEIGFRGDGQLTLGALDSEHCDAQFDYMPSLSTTSWKFELDGFTIGDFGVNKKQRAIIDIEASWLEGPKASVEIILEELGAEFNWQYQINTISCDQANSLPDLVYHSNGKAYAIPATVYVVDLGIGNGLCAVALMAVDSSALGTDWVLGDPFLRTFCTVYDLEQSQFGIAKSKSSAA